ncbi:MAG TPA: PDDEXK nuclease domain-containing protein [Bacteroidales bacterium]|nr:PDDEXK nuclease domain-containing protein [Bacteroidales bacterium]
MNFRQLSDIIISTNKALYSEAVKAVNISLTYRNWLFGSYIVKYEQNGIDRASYGTKLLKRLADKIKISGISETSLKTFRQFYLTYPEISQTLSDQFETLAISQTVSDQLKLTEEKAPAKSKKEILGSLSQKFDKEDIKHLSLLLHSVSYSHFVELIKIDDPVKRKFYELVTIRQTLSVRELKRQIESLSFERLGLSADKEKALVQIEKKIKPAEPKDAVKDLYFFEFLGLPKIEVVEESDLEQALLDHFQEFILELGMGFCIEARQKKILIGDEYFFIDLVLYHRILKCHVLVELKVDSFKHSHIAQLNTYVNYYKQQVKESDDNLPIGLLLVADQNKPLVEYALGSINNKLYVSKYQLQLPDTKDIEQFMLNELKSL